MRRGGGTIRSMANYGDEAAWDIFLPFLKAACSAISAEAPDRHKARAILLSRATILREGARKLERMAGALETYNSPGLAPEPFIANMGLKLKVQAEFEEDFAARNFKSPKIKLYMVSAWDEGTRVADAEHLSYEAAMTTLLVKLSELGYMPKVEGAKLERKEEES